MTDTMNTAEAAPGRDQTTGQFLKGFRGGPGRRPGSKNRITEEFLKLFAADVTKHGAAVIEAVRTEKPDVYLRIWSDLLPKEATLDVTIGLDSELLRDAATALEAYRTLADVIGANPRLGLQRLRRLAPQIEHEA
jgi:hypothetical protein